MVRATAVASVLAAVALLATGCGTTEKSGRIGDTLDANGVEVTVKKVDTRLPESPGDITGLSQASPGSELVGTLVKVCSEHGGAIGPWDFGVVDSDGKTAKLKFPQHNYAAEFDSQREGCGGGWVVFEVPAGSKPKEVTFGFEDTGSTYNYQDIVDAKFSWSVG